MPNFLPNKLACPLIDTPTSVHAIDVVVRYRKYNDISSSSGEPTTLRFPVRNRYSRTFIPQRLSDLRANITTFCPLLLSERCNKNTTKFTFAAELFIAGAFINCLGLSTFHRN